MKTSDSITSTEPVQSITETLTIVFLGIPEWHKDAACGSREHDPDDWFPDKTILGSIKSARAVRICRRECPVRTQCLQHAMENNEMFGIRGGYTGNQRTRLRRKNPAANGCPERGCQCSCKGCSPWTYAGDDAHCGSHGYGCHKDCSSFG